MKGQVVEWEAGFLELFPGLREIKGRYEIMFSLPSNPGPVPD